MVLIQHLSHHITPDDCCQSEEMTLELMVLVPTLYEVSGILMVMEVSGILMVMGASP